jgi:hypothetical protein
MWTKNEREEISLMRKNPLPDSLKGLLIGTVLGDGCLQCIRNNDSLAYLKVGNKIKEFVEYKKQLFSAITLSSTIIQRWEYKGKDSYHFNTIAHPDIFKLYQQMYRDRKKVITKDVFQDLTVAGLALWYLDDGYCNIQKRDYFLSTCNFSLEEHHMMREYLRKKFNIFTSIIHNGKYLKLYIAHKSRNQLEYLLRNFIPECMLYKYASTIQNPQRLNVSPL